MFSLKTQLMLYTLLVILLFHRHSVFMPPTKLSVGI